ncbi:MAG: FMN-binding protein [Treponema sp.]|nr:FMN-binding protein [Treponema sp.]
MNRFPPFLPFLGIAALSVFPANCLGLPPGSTRYTPGTYEAAGRGYYGPVLVQVQVSETSIEGIEILDHQEDYYALEAMEELRDAALEYGAGELDALSGATISSRGFLEALDNALNAAKIRQPDLE